MKVKCINNKSVNDILELGKIYEVLEEDFKYYSVKSEMGTILDFKKEIFEIVEEKEGNEMEKYKIYEALKMLEENKNLKFKNKHNEIMEYKQNCVRIFKDNKNIEFYGFVLEDEWELIKQPVTFEEVLNSDKMCRVEHELIKKRFDVDVAMYFEEFDDLIFFLSNNLNKKELKEIIKNGKWYLED